MTGTTRAGRGSEYAELSRLIRRDGLPNRRPRYYAVKITIMAVLYGAGWAAVAALAGSWYQLLAAGYLAGVFGQLAFLGHEAGHRQIFRTRRANDAAGLVLGDLLIGLSYGWWTGKHNRHHAHPNRLGRDPDISLAAVAFTPGQAAGRHRLHRALARYQAFLFFPMLLADAVSMHVISIWAVLHGAVPHGTGRPARALEGGLLLVHFAGHLGAAALLMPPAQAIAFVVVQQGLFGVYLGCAFAPNHKGMPVLGEQDNLDFSTTRSSTICSVHAAARPAPVPGPGPGVLRAAWAGLLRAEPGGQLCAGAARPAPGLAGGTAPRAPRSPLRAGRCQATAGLNPAAGPGRPAAAPAAGRNPPGRCPAAR